MLQPVDAEIEKQLYELRRKSWVTLHKEKMAAAPAVR